MISNFYNDGWGLEKDGTAVPIARDPDDTPSLRQLRLFIARTHGDIETNKKRLGDSAWAKDYRGHIGSTQKDTIGPGDRFQFDSTKYRGYLVNSYDRRWTVGRPIVYFVVDCYSDLVTGLHVAIEGPSWETGRIALFNSFTDKVPYCARYGVEIAFEDWPANILPNRVLPDRAELLSKNADGMVDGLAIIMEYPRAYRGDLKGLVESRIFIFEEMIYKRMPGKVGRNPKPGSVKPARESALTIDEFIRILIEVVLFYNKHAERPRLRPAAMIEARIPPTPINIWNWGIENITATPHYEPLAKIYSNLLPRGIAKIREDGISFQGRRYSFPRALSENWFERARARGTRDLPINFHAGSTNEIYIPIQREGIVEVAQLIDADERFKNRRTEDAVQLLERERLEAQERERDHRQGKGRVTTVRDQVFDNARRSARDSRNNAEAMSGKVGVQEARSLEAQIERARELQRGRSYLNSGGEVTPKGPAASNGAVGTRARAKVISLLQKKPGGDEK